MKQTLSVGLGTVHNLLSLSALPDILERTGDWISISFIQVASEVRANEGAEWRDKSPKFGDKAAVVFFGFYGNLLLQDDTQSLWAYDSESFIA